MWGALGRALISNWEKHPDAMHTIRKRLGDTSQAAIILEDLRLYLAESLEFVELPPAAYRHVKRHLGVVDDDPGATELARVLALPTSLARLRLQVKDMVKNVNGALQELVVLREMTDVISETIMFRSVFDGL